MTSSVDNKAPDLEIRSLLKIARLKADCKRLDRIMKENAALLASINKIKRTKGIMNKISYNTQYR